MVTHVALMRGINVGGHGMVAMADLCQVFVALGCTDVSTYIQSGNVLFTPPNVPVEQLRAAVAQRLRADLGVPVQAILRTTADIARLIGANPFLQDGASPARLHVTFLAQMPDPARAEYLSVPDAVPDEWCLLGREIYLHCPNGYGRTKLTNTLFERRLGVPATTRTWSTIVALDGLARGVSLRGVRPLSRPDL